MTIKTWYAIHLTFDFENFVNIANKTTKPATEHDKIPSDKGGNFKRPDSTFRNVVSADPSSSFPAEKGRYLLYVNYGCPWAHRAIITRKLKGLEDIVELVEVDEMELGKGWVFSGKVGPDKDPRYGFKYLRQLYEKADPEFKGRVTVPVLWDTKAETIVNNESSEIIRIFYDAFDQLLPEDKREATKGKAGIFPEHLHAEIEAMNEWVYDTVNNGVSTLAKTCEMRLINCPGVQMWLCCIAGSL